ncbi:MAG: GntR family transcriptional regulator [Verrucomicrobiales bacterium]|jgi:GntR family transcriptional regulator|nr:GntR family transcriptional regulator [Verrucomicrobiales bacterium]
MFLHLNPQSGEPVYRQMVRQLKQRIATGQLADGQQLPSVRDLSAELHVNPLTVAKAYQFLERDGLVEFRRGQGTFVAADRDRFSKAQQQKLIAPAVAQVVSEALHLGLSVGQLQQLIRQYYAKQQS